MTSLPCRSLASAPLALTTLGFGGAPIAGLYDAVSEEDASRTVAAAVEAGIGYFDTAPFYGHGLSEHRLGTGLRSFPDRPVIVSTKVGRLLRPVPEGPVESPLFAAPLPFTPVFDYGYDATMRSLEDSLQRLGRPSIDIALIHDCNPRWHGDDYSARFAEAMAGAYRALDQLRAQGVVKAIGVGVNECRVLVEFAKAGRFDCFMLAGRYTLLDQSALDELLPLCVRQSIRILLAAPFGSGILATGAKPGATYYYAEAAPEIMDRVRRLEEVGQRHGVPLPAAAIQFPLHHPALASVVVGMRSPAEVARNVELLTTPIPSDYWAELVHLGLLPSTAPLLS